MILMAEQRVRQSLGNGESLPVGSSRRAGTLEHFAIDLDVLLQVRGHVFFRKNRGDRTFRLTGTAIDALVRMDVELVRALVNAVDRTHIDAGAILCILAGFRYDVGHVIPDDSAAEQFMSTRRAIPLRKIDPLD
jgi:hypothetical protein